MRPPVTTDPVPPPASSAAAHRSPARWRLLLALAAFGLALVLFGSRYHWVEEAGTAERDGYVAMGEEIARGSLPRDPFRPLLYPLLIAASQRAGLAPLTAARLLTNLAAVGLLGLAWLFGRELGGNRGGAWTLAATAVNPNVWILGQHASTDMLFATLAAATLWGGLAYLERPRALTAVLTGAAYGAAAFTRSNAFFLLPALLFAFGLARWYRRRSSSGPGTRPPRRSSSGPRREAAAHLGLALGFALVFLAAHWALRYATFGDPFYDENWKNLAWKLAGFPDWSALDRVPYTSLWEVLRERPGDIAAGALAELGRFAGGGLAQLLGTPLHALALLAGSWLGLRLRHRATGWLLFAMTSFLALVATAFFTWGRLLLALLPLANALAFAPWSAPGAPGRLTLREAPRPGWVPGPRAVPLATALLAGLVILLGVKTFAFRLPAFIERHPYLEVATLRQLDLQLPPGAALGGTSPFLGRYLSHPYLSLPDAFGAEVAEPSLYLTHLRPLVEQQRVAYLVIGEVDLRHRPQSLLAPGTPAPWLEWVAARDGVAVWRVRAAAPRRAPSRFTDRGGSPARR